MKETIHFYHMNDWHSHLENWPKIQRYYAEQKKQHLLDGEAVYLFDIGDACDRQHPLTEATNGQAIIELMNQMGIDAATIGNNEGIGNPHQVLDQLYAQANFPVLVGNLVDKQTNQAPNFTKAYTIFQTENNTRIALLGMTAPFQVSYDIVGWRPIDPMQAIAVVLEQLRNTESYDLVILLSHLGLPDDREIAGRFPEIKLIFGAHTHHVLPEGEFIGHTLLTGGGKYGQFIGHVTVELETDRFAGSPSVIKQTAELIAADNLSVYPEDREKAENWLKQGNQLLKQRVVGQLPAYLANDEYHLNDLQLFIAKAIKQQTQADLVVLNSGLFLKPLAKGAVTHYDLHQSIPHPMRLTKIETDGAHLRQILLEMQQKQPELRERPISGMGFRGKIFGTLATYPENFMRDPNCVAAKKSYRLITVDHIVYLPFFDRLKDKGYRLNGPEFLREVVAQYLSKSSQD